MPFKYYENQAKFPMYYRNLYHYFVFDINYKYELLVIWSIYNILNYKQNF